MYSPGLLFAIACLPLLGVVGQKTLCDTECQKGCDAACQAAIRGAYEAESRSWVGDVLTDPFFVTTNTSSATPGDLIRWQDIPSSQLANNWTIPASLSLSRFMYVTEDVDRKPIPASAWVLLPFTATGDGCGKKLRTVVWTHGTAGRSRQCAPTNNRGLYYDWQAPFVLAEMGYAVIAPDYSGQGSDIPQGFMYEAGFLHAADAAYSVVAAKKALGTLLGEKWVVFGHSEGGMSAWRTNERMAMANQEALKQAGELVGSVAAAPALRPQKLIPDSMKRAGNGPANDPFSVYFLQSLSKLYPDQIKISDYLGDLPLQRLGVLDQSCIITGSAAVGNFTPTQLYKNLGWLTHPATDDWAVRYNGQGPHPLAAPMLVIQGMADTTTPANLTMADFDLTCSTYPESRVHARLYPEMAHGQVLEAAKGDILAWIAERFEGTPVSQGCSKENVQPLTDRYGRDGVFWTASVGQF
ncbi:uncharacterized protein E0L32_002592 [Thyridium curvatum]|uniref:AB hydrolase-1 domain-containing protein n=1 Tax=Thyridium curvatum TaxID=1093900 RepID=A0A507B6H7_9PEZI|nr:uncharacterized protein E0L32_002592 [Thyridium curvatum]TPX18735.1 hypothetical protein E0L32_002592 [Thyridium curvatum]